MSRTVIVANTFREAAAIARDRRLQQRGWHFVGQRTSANFRGLRDIHLIVAKCWSERPVEQTYVTIDPADKTERTFVRWTFPVGEHLRSLRASGGVREEEWVDCR